MSPVLLAIVLVLLGLIVYRKLRTASKSLLNYPPGPIRLPLIGSYLHVLWVDFYRPHLAFTKLKEMYGSPVIGFGMGGYNVVVANDCATIKELFNHPDLQGRVPAYPGLTRTFGEQNGFFGDDGPRWLHFRRSALRAMRDLGFGRRSEAFEAVVEEEARALVDALNDTKGQPTIAPEIFFHTLYNLINHLVHGVHYPKEDRATLTALGGIAKRLITNTDGTGRLIAIWPWIRYLFPVASGDRELLDSAAGFEAFVRSSYNSHLEDFDEEVQRDLLDYFIKNKPLYPGWTEEEILTGSMDLMFPNTAVAIVLTFTLAFLAESPETLRKCQQQLDDVVGRGRLPTLDDRQSLSMVEMSLRESMRLQPLAPLAVTHRATAPATLGGFHVEQDSLVIANLWAMNHDPELFDDPETFRPERFLDGTKADTTFPFGLGKRICAGETFARQNLFIVLATVLQNFDLEVTTPLDPERYISGLAIAPNPDFAIKFIPRS